MGSALDNQMLWDEMNDTLDFWAHLGTGRVVILEGHKILKNSESFVVCDLSFEIEIDEETGLQRRMRRTDYSDPVTRLPEYYRDITWPNHLNYIKIAETL